MDHDRKGPMWNFKRILINEQYDEPLLVLQDDVIFNRSFVYSIHEILAHMEKKKWGCISLFSPPRKYYLEQANKRVKYYKEKDYLWQPAILMSKAFREGLLAMQYTTKHDDEYVGEYAKRTKDYVRVTIPSLVRHDLKLKSTLGTGAKIGKVVRDTQIFHPVPEGYFNE